jgi:2-methylcitrate dehydratase
MRGNPITLAQPLNCYVIENILFKIAYPAEFHGQTAVECALLLHPSIKNNLNDIEKIIITTQQAGKKIIDKTGVLSNPADRDHCIQYMVACGLMAGELSADSYEDHYAQNSIIDRLRAKMTVHENPEFTQSYYDSEKRAIPNQIDVFLNNRSHYTQRIEYPLGHKRRRTEGVPLLWQKFRQNCRSRLSDEQYQRIYDVINNQQKLSLLAVSDFMSYWLV